MLLLVPFFIYKWLLQLLFTQFLMKAYGETFLYMFMDSTYKMFAFKCYFMYEMQLVIFDCLENVVHVIFVMYCIVCVCVCVFIF